MKKPKVTLRSAKKLYEGLQQNYAAYRKSAQEFIFTLQNPPSRRILSVDAADAQGKLNGMTIAELIAITNLLSAQGEKLYLVPQGKAIIGYAVKDAPRAPEELL
jgi:hypothetical protein